MKKLKLMNSIVFRSCGTGKRKWRQNCFIGTFTTLETLRMICTEAYCTSSGRFCNRLRHFANAKNVVSIRSGNIYTILLFLAFSLLYLPILLPALFALFMLVTIELCKGGEIQAYWFLMSFSEVKLLRVS